MTYFWLEKKLEDVIDLTVKFRGFVFLVKFLRKFCINYSKFVCLPEKIINFIQSFSFQLYEIIIDYAFKVN